MQTNNNYNNNNQYETHIVMIFVEIKFLYEEKKKKQNKNYKIWSNNEIVFNWLSLLFNHDIIFLILIILLLCKGVSMYRFFFIY